MSKHNEPEAAFLRLWHRVAEPRVQRLAYFFIYLFHIIAGVGVLTSLPTSVTIVLGQWPTVIWGGLLVVGGVFGAVAVLPGWNFVERIALIAAVAGISMASLLLLAQPPSGATLTLWALITGWLVVFVHRAWEIRIYSIAPTT